MKSKPYSSTSIRTSNSSASTPTPVISPSLAAPSLIPIILSGGSGTRLWPISRGKYPKQFCDLFAHLRESPSATTTTTTTTTSTLPPPSLQSLTLQRLSNFGNPIVVTSILLRDFMEKEVQATRRFTSETPESPHRDRGLEVLYEPQIKNTAPAIASICRILELQGRGAEVVGIFPADHRIENEEEYREALTFAAHCAKTQGKVVTLGIKPQGPETGFGYIHTHAEPVLFGTRHSAFGVVSFHEKPSLDLALKFLAQGNYYWNSGVFIFQVSKMVSLFQKFQPQIWFQMEKLTWSPAHGSQSSLAMGRGQDLEVAPLPLNAHLNGISDVYSLLPSISIDYAIMEKLSSEELLCLPCDPDWSDVGSWDAVAKVYETRGFSTELSKSIMEVDSKNNFVFPSPKKNYAFVGVDNLIVVDTSDALLVAQKGKSQEVKTIVERLKSENSTLTQEHTFDERPWGRFEVLQTSSYNKTKMIRVDPGAQLSYQSHEHREEHWVFTKGRGEVVLNDEVRPVGVGVYIKIPRHSKHRVRNTGSGPLEFIEIQIGDYFGEDDIHRYKDDYNRTLP